MRISPRNSTSNLAQQQVKRSNSQLDATNEPQNNSKWKNALIRCVWGCIMLAAFVAILYAGHVFVIILIAVCSTLVYREVIQICIHPSKERQMPWFRSVHWQFLLSTNYFLYGESIIHYYKNYIPSFFTPLATYHRMISFSLYILGFVFFVSSLQKGHYKFQLSHFCWTHMALLLVICQAHFIINNLLEGLIWFVLPVSLVIVNDIAAYVFGFFFGMTPLITLSPKKTWEGFLGGWLTTMIFAFYFSAALVFPYMTESPICRISGENCDLNPVFVLQEYTIPPIIMRLLTSFRKTVGFWPWLTSTPMIKPTITLYPLQLHSLAFAAFASLIAPFGGFFASGVKRAFKMKDFSDTIPGHGGFADRFDCQFVMGVFSFMYIQTFLSLDANAQSVDQIVKQIIDLDSENVKLVYERLGAYLNQS